MSAQARKSCPEEQSSSAPPGGRMTVDEFLKWSEMAEGRWELIDGVPVRKHDPAKGQSERAGHADAKFNMAIRLREAVEKAGAACHVLPDGMRVRISESKCYEPDALLYCGERLDKKALEVPQPLIIVEVLSPGTRYRDLSEKLADYFTLPSLRHYLVLDPDQERIWHYGRKNEAEDIIVTLVTEPSLLLDPPGIDVRLEDIFA